MGRTTSVKRTTTRFVAAVGSEALRGAKDSYPFAQPYDATGAPSRDLRNAMVLKKVVCLSFAKNRVVLHICMEAILRYLPCPTPGSSSLHGQETF